MRATATASLPLLSGQHVEVPLDLDLQWSSESGISFGASGKFEYCDSSTNLTLGPIHISSLTIAVSGRPARCAPTRPRRW